MDGYYVSGEERLGDFYLGHRTLGLMELFGYLIIWLTLIGVWVKEGPTAAIPMLVILAFALLSDFALTRHMALKGLIPTRRAWRSHVA